MFPKKRRDESLRVLTEKEIQEKLYGHCRSRTSTVVEDEPVSSATVVAEAVKKTQPDLFVPPAEVTVKKEPLFKPRPVPAPRKENHFFRNLGGSLKKSFFSAASKVSSVSIPRMPAMKKPRWIEKVEGLPLGSVAAAFFAAVLLVVGIRAAMHLGFNAWPIERILQAHKAVQPVDEASEPEELPLEERISIQVSDEAQVPAAVKKTEAKPAEVKAAALPGAKKFYTIQIVVYEDAALAAKQVKSLTGKKLDAFYKSVKTSRGREHYQVFVGRFTSFQEAQTQLSRYKKANLLAEFKDSFVRPQTE